MAYLFQCDVCYHERHIDGAFDMGDDHKECVDCGMDGCKACLTWDDELKGFYCNDCGKDLDISETGE